MVLDLFGKTKVPKKIPIELKNIVKKINKAKDQKEALKIAYKSLTKIFYGRKFIPYILLHRLLIKDPQKLLDQKGFLHCSNFNYLMRILLTHSKFFKDKDLKLKWTLIVISPHQYLVVKTKKESIYLDIWAANYGVKFGTIMSSLSIPKKKT
tara:strand:+ start:31 stop:486 length:456 start_codon:yes stop_codon:yes gene_type:complete